MIPLAILGAIDQLSPYLPLATQEWINTYYLGSLLPNLSPWLWLSLLLLITIVLLVEGAFRVYSSLEKKYAEIAVLVNDRKTEKTEQINDEYNTLTITQARFWGLLRETYGLWRGENSELPQSVDELAQLVTYHDGLPAPNDTNMLRWIDENEAKFVHANGVAWRFSTYIYTPNPRGGFVKRPELGARQDEFNLVRAEMTKFFDKLARHLCEYKDVNEEQLVARFFPDKFKTLSVLCYLELAQRRCTQTWHTGAQLSARLYRWAEARVSRDAP